jgi:hypothetical protein
MRISSKRWPQLRDAKHRERRREGACQNLARQAVAAL